MRARGCRHAPPGVAGGRWVGGSVVGGLTRCCGVVGGGVTLVHWCSCAVCVGRPVRPGRCGGDLPVSHRPENRGKCCPNRVGRVGRACDGRGRGVMIAACRGVCSSHANTHSVQYSCLQASFPLFHRMHGRSFYRMPLCLHAHSRRAHARSERLIITRFPGGEALR